MAEDLPFSGETELLIRLDLRPGDLFHLEPGKLRSLSALPKLAPEALQGGTCLPQTGEGGPVGLPHLLQLTVPVEDVQLDLRIEEKLVLVLSGYAHQAAAEIGQRRYRSQLAVQVHPVPSGHGEGSLDEKLLILLASEKQSSHCCFLASDPDEIRRPSTAQKEVDGVDQDGFPRPGLAGDDGE